MNKHLSRSIKSALASRVTSTIAVVCWKQTFKSKLTQKDAHNDSHRDCRLVIRYVIWRGVMEFAYFQLFIRLIQASNTSISLLGYLTGILRYSLNRTNMLLGITIESVKASEEESGQ